MPSFKVILGLLFILLTTFIVILAVLTLRSYGKTSNTTHWVEHSRQVVEQADEIASAFKTLQLESNAAFINPDTLSVRRYGEARDLARKSLSRLESLTVDNPNQQARVKELMSMMADLTLLTDSAFTYQETHTQANLNDRIAKNNKHRIRIQSAIDVFKREENALLISRQISNQQSMESSAMLSSVLLLLAFITTGTTFLSIRNNFNKRVAVEEELIKANELFFKLFYESPVALVITNPGDGVVVDCNDVYARLINYTREQIIGQTAKSLHILDETVQRAGYVQRAYKEGTVRDIEVRIHPKDRAPIWTNISMQPIHLKERECLLSAVQDVTPHKEAEARIKLALDKEMELNNLKSNFVTLASHEFRTPLTTVLSSAFLLENYLPADKKEKTEKHLSRIKSSVNTLTNILDEFLSLTKIEEGRAIASKEELDVKALVSSICAAQQVYAKAGQRIICSHLGDPIISSDPGILTGVITNLISNAIKYSPENADMVVSTTSNESVFELTVSDSGIGIPVEDQAHLFERFYRASNAGHIQGTGLGLHITKHYVDLLGGSIKFQSQPGQGSNFVVRINS